MKPFLTVAVVCSVFCNIRVRALQFNDSHHFTNKVPRSPACNGISCEDGRCVPDYSMCYPRNTDEYTESKNLMWKDGYVHYAFAGCGILVIVALLLSCLCSVQEVESRRANCVTSLRPPPKLHSRSKNSGSSKSESEIKYSWKDEQELYVAGRKSDVKLIKV